MKSGIGIVLLVSFFLVAVLATPGFAHEHEPTDTDQLPFVRPLDKRGFHLGFPLATVIPMLGPQDTGGVFEGIIEHIETDYYGPPHAHETSDETIIMTEGSVYMRLGDRDFTLTEGQWLHVPRGTVHSFKSTGSPAKWVLIKNPPPPPPRPPESPECDRASFTPEMVADTELMMRFYDTCLDDFIMVYDTGLPGTPYEPTSYEPGVEVRPWTRPLDRPAMHLGFPAASFTIMLTPEDTDGAFTGAVEHIETDYYGPPHRHSISDETIIMIDGSAHVRVNETDFTLTQGQWLHIPAGNVHGFKSTGSPAKWVILKFPAQTEMLDPDASPEECDRRHFTPAMTRDPDVMIPWYDKCAYDFEIVRDAGLPGE